MSNNQYTPEEAMVARSDNSKVILWTAVGTVAIIAVLVGVFFLGQNLGRTGSSSNSSSSGITSVSSSSRVSSVTSSVSSTVSSSVSSSAASVSSSSSASSSAASSSTPSVKTFSDTAKPGFFIGNLDGFELSYTEELGLNKTYFFQKLCPTQPKTVCSEDKLEITIANAPLSPGYEIDSAVTKECVGIGNNWNRCQVNHNVPTDFIRYYVVSTPKVNLIGRGVIMKKDQYDNVKTQNLGAVYVKFTMKNYERSAFDTLVSSIVF